MTRLADDARDAAELLRRTCEEAIRFIAGLADRPVNNSGFVAPPAHLPDCGIGAAAALEAFLGDYEAGLTASTGPRYFGFVTGGSTPAALAGDWLTSAYDQNACDVSSAAAFHVEQAAVAMFRELLALPGSFDGRFVTGATMSNFVGLAIARQWWGVQLGLDVAECGLAGLGPITVLSGTPHACIGKSLSMLGLGRGSLFRVPTLPGREAVDVAALERALSALAGRPCVVVANAGVVNTGDFDAIAAIARLRRDYAFYLHVDAAFGGFAACSPRLRVLLAGWEDADSIAIDGHKWLNVPYDSAVQLSRHPRLQRDVFQNTGAAYLGAATDADAWHLTPENSRRLRALPAWFALMAYGADGYRDIIESSCRAAALLGERIETSGVFRLLAPVRLNVVAFSFLTPGVSRETVEAFLARLTIDGRVFLTPTTYDGVHGMRAAFSNWRTTLADVECAFTALLEAAL